MLESRISSPYPGANHVAPPATKDEREYFSLEIKNAEGCAENGVVALRANIPTYARRHCVGNYTITNRYIIHVKQPITNLMLSTRFRYSQHH